MQKKISINMVDDVVESIEVDGVTYASPEEIPDPEDRAKVNALISPPEDEDFEPAFDEEAFDREFEEMQRESSKFPALFTLIFLGVAGILLTVAVISSVVSFRTVAKEQAAPGQVVELIERSSVDSETREVNIYSYPVVEFMVPGGSLQQVQLNEGSWPPAFHIGDKVTVLYDPDRPQNARIKSFSSSLLMWLLPAITGFVGAVFLAVGLFAFRLQRSGKKKESELSLAAG